MLNCKMINMLQEEENQMSLYRTHEKISDDIDTSMDNIELGQTVWFLAHDKYHRAYFVLAAHLEK